MDESVTGSRPNYLGVFRRQWLIVVGSVLVGGLAAGFLLASLPKAYASSASVLVQPTNSNTDTSDGRTVGIINMDTEAQVVTSMPVATAVKIATGSSLTTEQLSKRVSVSVPPNTTVLVISFQSTSAVGAQKLAQSFADSYLAFRSQQSQSMIDAQTTMLTKQTNDTRATIGALNRKIATLLFGVPARVSAQQDLVQARTRLKWLAQRLLPLQSAAAPAGSVIGPAPLNETPVKPSKVFVGASTLALFVLLGIALTWWRDGRAGLIRSPRQVEQELAVEVLGQVDRTSLASVEADLHSIQQYRQVVHAVVARLAGAHRALLITGVGEHSLAEDVAATVGAELGRLRERIVVVYTDDEAAAVLGRALLDYTSRPAGLTLTSLTSLDATVESGRRIGDLSSALDRAGEGGSRQVVVATPPTGLSADAQAAAPHVTFTLLVVSLNVTTRAEITDALRQLHQVGASDVGAVVITATRSRRRAGGASRRRWLAAHAADQSWRHAAEPSVVTVPVDDDEHDRLPVALPAAESREADVNESAKVPEAERVLVGSRVEAADDHLADRAVNTSVGKFVGTSRQDPSKKERRRRGSGVATVPVKRPR